MRYLGIDLGSSFLKGAVLNTDDFSISRVERSPFPAHLKQNDSRFREFDPNQVVKATRDLLEKLYQEAPNAQGILVCSQLHGLVLTDANGRALSNLITWQDQRALMPLRGGARTYFDEINGRITPEERVEMGNESRPGTPLCFLFWLLQNDALPPEGAIAASLSNYVIASLCRCSPKSDLTNAFAHGALNLKSGDWHREVLKKLGLDTVLWPELVQQGQIVGEAQFGVRRLPFFAPVGDYQCSQVGAFLEAGELSINISTGSAVLQLAQGLEFGDFQTRPFFDGNFLRTITHIPGGRALTALIRLLSELAGAQGIQFDDPWEYILNEAARVETTTLRVSPAFYFSAMGDHGEITNITEENLTVGQLFRATFEGMAENYAHCARRISPIGDWRKIVFSGGVALKIKILRELICKRLGKEYRLVSCEEDTLLGLLVLSLAFCHPRISVTEAMALTKEHYQPIA